MTSTALPANPFPGMNPYLENPGLWPDVHNSVIVGLRTLLARQLRPEYRVTTVERVYVMTEPGGNGSGGSGGNGVRIPDVAVLTAAAPDAAGNAMRPMPARSKDAIAVQLPATELLKERYLEVRRVHNRQVIAIIELLSPTNKGGDGYREYLGKRAATLYSPTHLVEIDLLRAGRRMPVIGPGAGGSALSHPGGQRPAQRTRGRFVRLRHPPGDTGFRNAAGARGRGHCR